MIVIKRKPKEKTKDLDFKIGDIVIFNGFEPGWTSICLKIGYEYEIYGVTTNGKIRFDPRLSVDWYSTCYFSKKHT
jgi:hypothetical protein